MKALSLKQPWATLVAISAKRFETRNWSTPYRGPLAIHASKGFPLECRELCSDPEFARALASINARFSDLPLGCVLATVNLVGCYYMGSLYAPSAADLFAQHKVPMHPELAFGDFSYGRWAWAFEDVKQLARPIPAKGALSLWEWKR